MYKNRLYKSDDEDLNDFWINDANPIMNTNNSKSNKYGNYKGGNNNSSRDYKGNIHTNIPNHLSFSHKLQHEHHS